MVYESGNETIIDLRPMANVRTAYTLNNMQPVRSTFIGAEPLFYMDLDIDEDDEEIIEEDYLFEDALSTYLEDQLNQVAGSIRDYDDFAADFAQSPEDRLQEFYEDMANITADPQQPETANSESAGRLLARMSGSKLAGALIMTARDYNTRIQLTNHVSQGLYDRETNTIAIRADMQPAMQLMILGRELRRMWQHRAGALVDPLLFHPDDAVIVARLQQADLAAAQVRMAWELHLTGDDSAWEIVENSTLHDMGRAVAREARSDFRNLANGRATASALEVWFISERCRACDRALIQHMLADHQNKVFGQDRGLSRQISAELIAALGTMPYGKNYLAALAGQLMSDPVFTDVRDRSNANFLWFIKFEQSYRDTERELHSGSNNTPSGTKRAGNFPDKTGAYGNGDNNTKTVIELYTDRDRPVQSHRDTPGDTSESNYPQDNAEIVDLQSWLAGSKA